MTELELELPVEYELKLIDAWRSGLTPVLRITADKWADENIELTTENSAKPGKWRTSRTPYMRDILADLSPTSQVKEVVWAKGVQIGATSVGLICMLCYAATDPCAIMYVLPTVNIAKGFSKTRLQKIINRSEILSDKIKPANERGSGNTIQEKEYPGGYIVLAGANSAAELRSRPIRVLILDETDAYPLNLDKEGSPIALAEERTNTFETNKKIFKLSTPTVEGSSVIWDEFLLTDQRYFYVPCPECGEYQNLEFEQLKWQDPKFADVTYECKHCRHLIDEKHKEEMLAHGYWHVTRPDLTDMYKKGYHLNSLYSAPGFLSWRSIAYKWTKAIKKLDKGDDNLFRTFTNTICGHPYSESGESPDWEMVYKRTESYKINTIPTDDVYLITVGVDIQGNRIELEIVGWGKNYQSWSIDYRTYLGKTADAKDPVWNELEKVVYEKWSTPDGREIPVRLMSVDSGYQTTIVYNWCNRFSSAQVVPVDGRPNSDNIFGVPFSAHKTKAGKGIAGLKVFPLGTFKIKDEFYTFLKVDDPEKPGYCHFPQYAKIHFEGLTAEEKITTQLRGYHIQRWNKKFERNEPLDCRAYARAAAAIIGYDRYKDDDFDNLYEEYTIKKIEAPKKMKRKSDFI